MLYCAKACFTFASPELRTDDICHTKLVSTNWAGGEELSARKVCTLIYTLPPPERLAETERFDKSTCGTHVGTFQGYFNLVVLCSWFRKDCAPSLCSEAKTCTVEARSRNNNRSKPALPKSWDRTWRGANRVWLRSSWSGLRPLSEEPLRQRLHSLDPMDATQSVPYGVRLAHSAFNSLRCVRIEPKRLAASEEGGANWAVTSVVCSCHRRRHLLSQ